MMISFALCSVSLLRPLHDFVWSVVRSILDFHFVGAYALSFRSSFRSPIYSPPWLRSFYLFVSGRAAREPPGADSGGRMQLQEIQVPQAVSASVVPCRALPCHAMPAVDLCD